MSVCCTWIANRAEACIEANPLQVMSIVSPSCMNTVLFQPGLVAMLCFAGMLEHHVYSKAMIAGVFCPWSQLLPCTKLTSCVCRSWTNDLHRDIQSMLAFCEHLLQVEASSEEWLSIHALICGSESLHFCVLWKAGLYGLLVLTTTWFCKRSGKRFQSGCSAMSSKLTNMC